MKCIECGRDFTNVVNGGYFKVCYQCSVCDDDR